MEHRAVAVGQHLDLDVARPLDVALDKHARVGEAGARLVGRGDHALGDLLGRARDAHALAAAAGRRLDHHRVADRLGDLDGMLGALERAEEAGHRRHAGGLGQLLRLDLVAHRRDGARPRADESDAGRAERLGEGGALGQEAEAGMHRLRPGVARRRDEARDVEVALGRGGAADRDRLVGLQDVQRVGVGLGVDRDRGDAHAPGGAHDAAGDLAAVGDQELLEHRGQPGATAGCCRASSRDWSGPCAAAWRARGSAGSGCCAA